MRNLHELPRAKKALGQHFLTDPNVVSELIDMMALPRTATVLEVGPGPGILTRALADHCQQVHAVELDKDMIEYLGKHLNCANVEIHEGDILKTDVSALASNVLSDTANNADAAKQQLYVASNLPYQISSPFLFHLIDHLPWIAGIGLMLQKEVVDRLVATPGDSNYGRLSVMIQYYFELTRGSDVPASAFTPPPAVESALVSLTPKALTTDDFTLAPQLSRVVKQAFSQRRKTLRNTLKPLLNAEAIQALSIDPGARAQTLGVEDFIRLAKAVGQQSA